MSTLIGTLGRLSSHAQPSTVPPGPTQSRAPSMRISVLSMTSCSAALPPLGLSTKRTSSAMGNRDENSLGRSSRDLEDRLIIFGILTGKGPSNRTANSEHHGQENLHESPHALGFPWRM